MSPHKAELDAKDVFQGQYRVARDREASEMAARSIDRVIIAGAGPAGLVTGLSLGLQDIPVVIFEALPAPSRAIRASTFHPPTLDMLETLGVTAELVAAGETVAIWQVRDRKHGKIAEFDLSVLGDVTAHPYRLHCEQHVLNETLHRKLEQVPNVEVRFGARVVAVDPRDDGIEVMIETADGRERHDGRILVGADGGRSAVRRSLGLSFDGFTFEQGLVQIGTPFDYRSAMPDICQMNFFSDPDEWCVLFHVPGYWRINFPIASGESDDEALSDDKIRQRLENFCPASSAGEIVHRNAWRLHQRVASDFRRGRVVLAGDAAHINSPFGGLGMNSGIHDAYNLSAKLVSIWRGEATLDALDQYTRQRRAVAMEDVQAQTIRNAKLLNERDPEIRERNLEETRSAARTPASARQLLLKTSLIEGLQRAALIE